MKTLKGASFSSEARIELDLNLSKADSKKYIPIITAYTGVQMNYLTENDNGVLISDKLSKYLNAGMGDSIVLLGQGYQGMSAAGIFPVRGIVKIPSPELDNKLIYMTLSAANTFLSLNGRITSIAINLKDSHEMTDTQKELNNLLPEKDYVVKNWEEIIPTMKQQIEGDNKSGQIFLGIIYFIVFFGIFGTVLMMIAERMREFGMMVAIGMKQSKLALIVGIEMIFMGIIGALSGMLVSVPFILYGYYHPFRFSGNMAKIFEDMGFDPVMPMAWFDPYFFIQGLIIMVMVLLACYFPVRSIMKMNVMKAIHG